MSGEAPGVEALAAEYRATAISVARGLATLELRDAIATEREQGRAFGIFAEACRDELAKRTGDPRV